MGVTAGGAPLAPTYEPDEAPTRRIVAGLGGQLALLMVVPLAILPALVVQLAGESDAVAARAVVASMVVCGLTTLALTVRLGRLRSDSLYVATVDLVSLPFCILALASGGPATLAALVVVSGLFQVAIGLRMSYLRRLVTPQVRGTVLILAFAALVPVLADAGSAVEQRLVRRPLAAAGHGALVAHAAPPTSHRCGSGPAPDGHRRTGVSAEPE